MGGFRSKSGIILAGFISICSSHQFVESVALDDNEAEHEDNATQEDSLEGEQHITGQSLSLLCLLILVAVFFSVLNFQQILLQFRPVSYLY